MTFFTASLIFILDRITKAIAVKTLALDQSIKIIPDIFHITLVFNSGTAFGFFKGKNIFFIPLSILITTLIIVYALKRRIPNMLSAALGLILGGAVGNLLDRLRFGCVIDFLDFRIWPVFNVADSAITIGTAILIWFILMKKAASKT